MERAGDAAEGMDGEHILHSLINILGWTYNIKYKRHLRCYDVLFYDLSQNLDLRMMKYLSVLVVQLSP